MKGIALLCLAACLSVAFAAADKPSTSIFMDYLDLFGNPATPMTKAKPAFYDGVEVETDTVCMQTTNYCNSYGCYENDSCNWVLDLACSSCHPDGYSAPGAPDVNDIMSSRDNVAKCIISETSTGYLDLPEKPGMQIVGTFTGQCIIKDDKDTCGHPDACDNVIVQITGVQYYIDTAVREGSEVTYTDCGSSGSRTGGRAARSAKKAARVGKTRDNRRAPAAAGKAGMASGGVQAVHDAVKAAAAAYDGPYDGPFAVSPLTIGDVYVFVGSMTVASRHHPVKFNKGWWQYSYFDSYFTPSNMDAETISKLPRFATESVKFEFISEEEAHHY